MILSRKWLNEFVDCSAWADHDFSEAMTLSGSKVETFTDLHKNIQNVVAGRIVEMVRQPPADVPRAIDVAQAILTQIGISMVSI